MKQETRRKIVAHLLSQAGLIEVPERILQDGIAWAKSVYCKKVLQAVNNRFWAIKNREELANRLREVQTSPLFQKAAEVENGEELFKLLSDNNDINIAYFKSDEYQNGFRGTYDWVKPKTLSIALRHLKNERYNFFLTINYAGSKTDSRNMDVSKEEIIALLRSWFFEIQDSIKEFISFVDDFVEPSKWDKQQVGFVYAICKQNIKEEYTNGYNLQFSLEESKYFLPEEAARMLKVREMKPIEIKCEFVFSKSTQQYIYGKENWMGLWNGNLYIFKDEKQIVGDDPEQIERDFADIEKTIRHELQHMIQTYLSDAKATFKNNENGEEIVDKHPYAGLPGKKYRIPEYTQDGQSFDPDNKERLPHTLRDVEFYTNLTDNLDYYKQVIPLVPLNLRGEFFKAWVGQMKIDQFEALEMDDFFKMKGDTKLDMSNKWFYISAPITRALEKSQRFFGTFNATPKYEKAIKVLYAELAKLGLV